MKYHTYQELIEWLEASKASVQWNARIEKWEVRLHGQMAGCLASDPILIRALSEAKDEMTFTAANRNQPSP